MLNAFTIDLITVFIICLFAFFAAKKGFAESVISFFGWLISLLAAVIISRAGALFIYEVILKHRLLDFISTAVANSDNSAIIAESLNEMLATLPQFMVNMMEFETGGVGIELNNLITENSNAISEAIMMFVAPIIKTALRGIIFIVVFVICKIVVKIISSVFKLVKKLPLLGSLDGLAGFVFGTLKGIIVMYIIGNILMFAIKATNNTLNFISLESVSQTKVFSTLVSLGKLMGI